MGPTIDTLTIADDPVAWREAGFTVDEDGSCRIGLVTLALTGAPPPGGDPRTDRGIRGWSLRDADAAPTDGTLDGIPTDVSARPPADPAEHANGARRLDHLVLLSGDGLRTQAALAAVGWDLRRVRPVPGSDPASEQRFFRAGEVILELVAPIDPDPNRPTRFFGLAAVVDDLDATVASYHGACSAPKDAVQPGRRIATLRSRDLDLSVAVAFMTPER